MGSRRAAGGGGLDREVISRIGALLQALAGRAMGQVPSPMARQQVEVGAERCRPWLRADLPMRARVWAALTEIREARLAGTDVTCVLPDTLRPTEVESWLRRHDALSDEWMEVIGTRRSA